MFFHEQSISIPDILWISKGIVRPVFLTSIEFLVLFPHKFWQYLAILPIIMGLLLTVPAMFLREELALFFTELSKVTGVYFLNSLHRSATTSSAV